MQLINVEFPRRIAMGAKRTPAWATSLAGMRNGFESTNQDWSESRHAYELSFAVRTGRDYQDVVDHFHQVRGRAIGFLFRDVLDYRAEASNGLLMDSGDSPTTGYQLAKRYGSVNPYDRRITRPDVSTVHVYRTRSGTTTDITASCTISATTGWVTISGGVVLGGDVLAWAGQFFVPCRYDTDALPGVIVDRKPGTTDYADLLVQCDSIPIVEFRE